MSMHNYPCFGLSLVIPYKYIKGIKEKLIEDGNEIRMDLEVGDYIDNAVYYYEDDVESPYLETLSGECYDQFGDILVIYAAHQPDAFDNAYSSKEELLDEFKGKVGEYLPEDFDYEEHIGMFSGVVWS